MNSAAVFREMPRSRAPIMVAPEREVPGNAAAKSCHAPIITACLYVISAIELTENVAFLFLFSTSFLKRTEKHVQKNLQALFLMTFLF